MKNAQNLKNPAQFTWQQENLYAISDASFGRLLGPCPAIFCSSNLQEVRVRLEKQQK